MNTVFKNWVWCEDCLEWKDAADEVSFVHIEEDTDNWETWLTFECDKCGNTNYNNILSALTKPRGNKNLKSFKQTKEKSSQ